MPKRDIPGFIAHWSAASPSERANSQAFLLELCELLEVPAPDNHPNAGYFFDAKKDLPAQLLGACLNQQIAAKIEKGERAGSSGVSKNDPEAMRLVTADCIRPVEDNA